tara:strand:+ start:1658 stop:2551 length:894 start_codon:yes stop_codon:yes gene_type:complete
MDFYEILGSDKTSTTKEIKKHYYSLSKKYHPDKNNGISDEKFKLLSEAYSVLSNPKKRYIYDMKLLFKNNLGDDFIDNFSDQDLIILHNYYQSLTESTEFKFLRLLYNSLPHNLKEDVKMKFKGKIRSESLIDISEIKYIYASNLNENFEINLNRSLKDVYLNMCKEIIIVTSDNVYDIFITHSDYTIKIFLKYYLYLTIHIKTILPDKYSLNGNDLYYNHRINLYEYYFIDLFPITLPNNFKINLINSEEFNSSVRIPCLGMKGISKRGDLYIYKELDLTLPNKDHYREILKEIFT